MIAGVLGDAVEDVRHLAAAHDGLELGGGELNRHIEVAGVAAVDDHGGRAVVVHAREQARHQVERPLRGRQADALEATTALAHQGVQSFEAQRQVAAPLVAGQRVHLVHDHRPHAPQQRPRRGRGQQEVERLRRGHQQVGCLLLHGGTLGRRRVPRADGDAQPRIGEAEAGGLLPDFREGDVEVLVHVDGQCPQRRDIEDVRRAPRPRSGLGRPVGGVDGDQESRERLARARGGRDQDVAPRGNVGPGRRLRWRRPGRKAP